MKDLNIIRDIPSFADGSYSREDDAFDHEAIAETVFRVLNENDPPMTIGLFGSWGVGKTSIVNLVEAKCKNNPEVYHFVNFNAWAYSGDSLRRQLLLTLADSFIRDPEKKEEEIGKLRRLNYAKALEDSPGDSIEDLFKRLHEEGWSAFFNKVKANFKEAFRDVKLSKAGLVSLSFSALFLLAAVVFLAYGFAMKDGEIQRWSLLWFTLSAASFFKPKVEQVLVLKRQEVFDAKLIFPEQFEEHYNLLLHEYANHVQKVVIVIDDLDRCDPDTIRSVLVTLKNFMGKGKTIFLVPMDDSSVVRMFKETNPNFGYEQLRKYFSISVRIPPFRQEDLLDFARRVSRKIGIPPKVAWVAAQGYCHDAREMKHFFNLYKLKYALAEARLNKKFLPDVDLEKISEELAKLVVLEYQFPEFYHFISSNPEKFELMSDLARDIPRPELDKVDLKEVSGDLAKLDNPKISDLWRTQSGLKGFLSRTFDIALENFDVISKLKTSNQEYAVSDFARAIGSAVTGNEKINLDGYLTEEIARTNGSSITDVITSYFDPDFPRPTRVAFQISIDILKKNLLDHDQQSELLRSAVSIATNPSCSIKLSVNEALVFLDNLSYLGSRQQIEFGNKILSDVFLGASYHPEYWRILNHPAVKKILSASKNVGQRIAAATEKWFGGLKDNDARKIFLEGIAHLDWPKDERALMGLIFPSNNLLSELTALLMTDVPDFDHLIVDTVLNKKNPEDYSEEKIGLGKKMSNVLAQNIPAKTINPAFLLACSTIYEMPEWLDEQTAIIIGSQIINAFPDFKHDKGKQLLLDTLLVAYCSLDKYLPKKREFGENYLLYCDGLAPAEVILQAVRIKSGALAGEEAEKAILPQLFLRRWSSVSKEIDSPSESTIENARLCREFRYLIPASEYKDLILHLTKLPNQGALEKWSAFFTEELRTSELSELHLYLDQLRESLSSKSLATEMRLAYGELLIKLLLEFPVDEVKQHYERLFLLLSDEDTMNVTFVADQFPTLSRRFGNDVPIQKANEVAETLLNRNDIGRYSRSIKILLGFATTVRQSIWEIVANKVIADLQNESKDVEHRWQLLELLSGLRTPVSHSDQLTKTLYEYREAGKVDQLKKKANELCGILTGRKIMQPYSPRRSHDTTAPSGFPGNGDRSTSLLKVTNAVYGTVSKSVDVTTKLNGLIRNNHLSATASNALGGDPNLEGLKRLVIIYEVGGKILKREYVENEKVELP